MLLVVFVAHFFQRFGFDYFSHLQAPTREMPREHSFSSLTNIPSYSGYDFTPRFAHDTMSMGRAPVKRGSFQKRNDPPVKVIHIRRSEDVQLHKTEQAWKPALVVKDDSDPEAIKTAVSQLATSCWTDTSFLYFISMLWSCKV